MVYINIVDKPGFRIAGKKTWIAGTDNAQFERFWNQCQSDGTVPALQALKTGVLSVTGGEVIGLSCTDYHPEIREFDFYICTQITGETDAAEWESREVKPMTWAVFSSDTPGVEGLLESEMYAWTKWLPENDVYIHDNGPEMEVYADHKPVEYWVPVRKN